MNLIDIEDTRFTSIDHRQVFGAVFDGEFLTPRKALLTDFCAAAVFPVWGFELDRLVEEWAQKFCPKMPADQNENIVHCSILKSALVACGLSRESAENLRKFRGEQWLKPTDIEPTEESYEWLRLFAAPFFDYNIFDPNIILSARNGDEQELRRIGELAYRIPRGVCRVFYDAYREAHIECREARYQLGYALQMEGLVESEGVGATVSVHKALVYSIQHFLHYSNVYVRIRQERHWAKMMLSFPGLFPTAYLRATGRLERFPKKKKDTHVITAMAALVNARDSLNGIRHTNQSLLEHEEVIAAIKLVEHFRNLHRTKRQKEITIPKAELDTLVRGIILRGRGAPRKAHVKSPAFIPFVWAW